MKKLLIYHLKTSSREKGFITLEILISLLIATAFLAVAMQSLVYAMAIKVQAQEKQRSNQLITENLEVANELANRSDITGSCDPANYDKGYGYGLWEAIKADSTPTTITLLSDGGGRQLALDRTPLGAGSSVAPHRILKIRYEVWNWDGTDFLDRAGNIKDAADEPIAENYVEIIPDVALACP